MNSSWAVRVHREDLFILQVDGTAGSVVAGLRDCETQDRAATPRAVWNPDLPSPFDYLDGWQAVPATSEGDNAFKIQWETFLRHVFEDAPHFSSRSSRSAVGRDRIALVGGSAVARCSEISAKLNSRRG